jgi:diguanylate cyclase (GGDEF)-like protein
MTGTYDWLLVVLSLVVAIVASFTALELAGRVSGKGGRALVTWIGGGALSMGIGIWSMHFIGMLAFHLPVAVEYELGRTVASLALAIAVSGLALYVMRRPALALKDLFAGSVLMGSGISGMHYLGMDAMQMSPPIEYHPVLLVTSVGIAVAASFAALWIAFRLRRTSFGVALAIKVASASVMGVAITGMHYTGMAAGRFAPDSICVAAGGQGMSGDMVAAMVGAATLGILGITLAIAAFDAHRASQAIQSARLLRASVEELRGMALHDGLTGLPNRMLLRDRVAQAVTRAQRARGSFAVMFIDLDRFKAVNDTLGHMAGDELLKAVASRLTGCVRQSDTVARTGGDEFVVVLGEISQPEDASLVGGKILDELSREFSIHDRAVSISASVGIGIYPRDGLDMETLAASADSAMYRAKKAGRNACHFASAGREAHAG